MVRISVRDMAARGKLGDHEQRDARAVAEEVQRLNVPGVVVAAAFIVGDEDHGVLPVRRVA